MRYRYDLEMKERAVRMFGQRREEQPESSPSKAYCREQRPHRCCASVLIADHRDSPLSGGPLDAAALVHHARST